ncbi:hypothetical protein [Brucella intermedia]|uniref:hypothetical protein n=1 Tax=Brucella intermedia TaxID=94625 RepID=UPI002248A4E9|nr:hypothetical protein [Brucella intermedia]
MTNNVDLSFLRNEIEKLKARADTPLKDGSGGGTFDGMNTTDINNRLHRIEGGWTIFQWACAVVTAVMVGGMGLLLAVQLSTQSEVKALSSQVEALPDRINTNLMELNRTLSTAITASKNQTPQVILVPAPAVQPPTQTTPNQ